MKGLKWATLPDFEMRHVRRGYFLKVASYEEVKKGYSRIIHVPIMYSHLSVNQANLFCTSTL